MEKLTCSECFYRRKCELGTDEAVKYTIDRNRELLQHVSTASTQRFVDKENVLPKFKKTLNSFFDVLSVLYTIPMNGYFLAKNASEDDQEKFQFYQAYRQYSHDRCIHQAEMRILTLGRASCGFVGAYSSGKTSYLNAEVFGGDLLPVGVGQTTSIPTYIFPGRNDKLVLENMRGNIRVSSDFEILKQLAHSSKPEGCPCRFQWDTVIKRLFCFSSKLSHQHDLVYVDLPGYSASVDDNNSMKEAMEGCDKIVYFKPVQDGGLVDTDIDYLRMIDGKDVMVVLSKADKKSPSDCKKILDLVKTKLEDAEIAVKGVVLYTKHPDKFSGDADFYRQLASDREELKEYILDTSAKEEDMALSNAVMSHYLQKYTERENELFSELETIEGLFDGFLGKKALDGDFFKTWKSINKSIADSSGSYVDSHFFSANTVRIGDYLNANYSRIVNYYNADTYDSNFNFSYQIAMYGWTLMYLYKTALYTQLTGQADSNYSEACKAIDGLEKNHSAVRKQLDSIIDITKGYFNYQRNLAISIAQDAKLAFEFAEQAYRNLMECVRNYEKEWSQT